jgi:hypothetical protein
LALAKNKAAAGAGQVGGFEQDDTVTTASQAEAKTAEAPKAAPSQEQVDAAAKATGTALAAAKSTAVAVTGKVVTALAEYKDQIPRLDFGVLPRLVGSNGNLMDPDKKLLGSKIKLQLVSFNDEFVVSPGDDSDEAKEAVRYSADGKVLDGTGESVDEYLKQLREVDGYEKAAVKQYCHLVGILLEAEKDPSNLVNQMVLVSLSPQSRNSFEGHKLQLAVKLRLAQVNGTQAPTGLDILTITAEVKTNRANQTFTTLKVSS